jgi:hypothetical protein
MKTKTKALPRGYYRVCIERRESLFMTIRALSRDDAEAEALKLAEDGEEDKASGYEVFCDSVELV